MRYIVPVVEGPGHMEATPILLRKSLSGHIQGYDFVVAKPKKVSGRSTPDHAGGTETYVEYAATRTNCAAILVQVDADDDCAPEWAERICGRCKEVGFTVHIAVVWAVRGYGYGF